LAATRKAVGDKLGEMPLCFGCSTMAKDSIKSGEHPAIPVPLIGGAVRPPQHIEPEFVDCKGLEAGWGIKRSLAYELLNDGKIRSVSLRRRGALRGKRLFSVDSVRSFLREQMEGAE